MPETPLSDAFAAIRLVVAALERLGVQYYLGGSIASSAYGMARATLDADLVADLSLQHATPLVTALGPDFYADANMISDAIRRKSCFNVIHLATMFKVDVFAVKDRDYDREAMRRIRKDTLVLDQSGVELFLAAAEDVLLNKLEWFRLGDQVSERQWHDVLGVLKVQHGRLDMDYLNRWADRLGLGDLLQEAIRQAASALD